MSSDTFSLRDLIAAERTSFIGRKAETVAARKLLVDARLLTLTGAAGAGKSRLARKTISDIQKTGSVRVFALDFAELAPEEVADRTLAAAWIAAVRDSGNAVVLVDNADSHADSHADDARIIIDGILDGAPEARVIATCRHALAIAGEALLEVAPFTVDSDVAAHESPAEADCVKLFADRARLAVPTFALSDGNAGQVLEICAQLDGLPAAIEVAASALRIIPLDRIRAALIGADPIVDFVPAARALAESVDAEFARRTPAERHLLAVAAGMADNFAMECLTDLRFIDLGLAERTEAFFGLVDHSLFLRAPNDEGRFRILRSVRRRGLEELAATDAVGAFGAGLEKHLVDLLTNAAEKWTGPQQQAVIRHLRWHRRDISKLLETLAASSDRSGDAITLIAGLRRYWLVAGQVDQAQKWLETAIENHPIRDVLVARALWVRAYLVIMSADQTLASALLLESVSLSEHLDEPSELFSAKFIQAMIGVSRFEIDAAEQDLLSVVEHTKQQGSASDLGEQYYFLVLISLLRGDHIQAELLFQESIQSLRVLGDTWGMANAMLVLAISLLHRGQEQRAAELAKDCLAVLDGLGDETGFPTCLKLLATVAFRQGDAVKAATLLAAAQQLSSTRTMVRNAISAETDLGLRKVLGNREYYRITAKGRRLGHSELMALAMGESGSAGEVALTRRELEIAQKLVEGMSNSQIAAALVVSPRTVEGHIQRILSKLQFRSRSQIAVWMAKHHEKNRPRPLRAIV